MEKKEAEWLSSFRKKWEGGLRESAVLDLFELNGVSDELIAILKEYFQSEQKYWPVYRYCLDLTSKAYKVAEVKESVRLNSGFYADEAFDEWLRLNLLCCLEYSDSSAVKPEDRITDTEKLALYRRGYWACVARIYRSDILLMLANEGNRTAAEEVIERSSREFQRDLLADGDPNSVLYEVLIERGYYPIAALARTRRFMARRHKNR